MKSVVVNVSNTTIDILVVHGGRTTVVGGIVGTLDSCTIHLSKVIIEMRVSQSMGLLTT